MFNAFFLSLGQLSDKRILALLLKVFGITLLLMMILGTATYLMLDFALDYFAIVHGAMFLLAAAMAIFVALLLFRIIAMFVINIFSDDVVDAVEAEHYPAMAVTAKPPGYILGLKMGLKSAARALGYNILAAPVYLILLVTGIGAPIAFFAVNAILIGRDLQDMVASRHVGDIATMGDEWRLRKSIRFGLGLVTALLLAVPFANFLAPVLGAAMATHLVHQQRGNNTQRIEPV